MQRWIIALVAALASCFVAGESRAQAARPVVVGSDLSSSVFQTDMIKSGELFHVEDVTD